jgi:hypothetical protein
MDCGKSREALNQNISLQPEIRSENLPYIMQEGYPSTDGSHKAACVSTVLVLKLVL